ASSSAELQLRSELFSDYDDLCVMEYRLLQLHPCSIRLLELPVDTTGGLEERSAERATGLNWSLGPTPNPPFGGHLLTPRSGTCASQRQQERGRPENHGELSLLAKVEHRNSISNLSARDTPRSSKRPDSIMAHLPLLLLILPALLPSPTASVGIDFALHRCEPIAVEACQGIGYNATTKMHNLAGHAEQRDAEVLVRSFMPLIHYKCSANLRFLLCSVLTPMCDPKWPKPIGPCRPLCQHVRSRCSPVLADFGFEWPAFLNCSRFPLSNARGDDMCMAGSPEVDPEEDGPAGEPVGRPGRGGGSRGGSGGAEPAEDWRLNLEKWLHAVRTQSFGPDCGHMRNREQYVYINQTADCLLRCGAHDLFSQDDKRLADAWVAVLATLCALSSLLTIATFLMDRSRFKYPVRPVLFMALCYLCYSLSYFVRLAAGREAASCDRDQLSGSSVLIRHGLDNTNCAVVFLLQYFFSMAASTWYVMLVFTWLLQAGWKWSPEAVARKSCYFHLPAWVVPVCLTVCVLIVRKVEADELFGMCNVGNQNSHTLLSFVIVPNVVFLALEVIFLLAGFVAMARVRRHVKSDGQKTNKFDMLMGKIGLFSALYVVPNACITAFNIYDYSSRDLWHVPGSPYRPSLAVFLIKVFASLVIGVTTILWIWSAKTLQTWRRLLAPWSASSPARVHLPLGAGASGSMKPTETRSRVDSSDI
uniref:Frizzled-4 n=1 Tax=Macrostomum lignano TaxID=282301 RepID=A0A1I8ISN5_9PLAT